MNRNVLETVMGAVVLAVAGVFVVFAYSFARVQTSGGYEVTARFDHVDGTRDGGDVRVSGIKVGTIISETLDPKTFQSIVRMNIDDSVKLPTDSVASITSAGLLGDKYMQLVPGADDQTIPPGGAIKFTQSPVSLESLLGQFVFSMTGGKSTGSAPADGSTPSPTNAAPVPSGPAPSAGPVPSHGAGKP